MYILNILSLTYLRAYDISTSLSCFKKTGSNGHGSKMVVNWASQYFNIYMNSILGYIM